MCCVNTRLKQRNDKTIAKQAKKKSTIQLLISVIFYIFTRVCFSWCFFPFPSLEHTVTNSFNLLSRCGKLTRTTATKHFWPCSSSGSVSNIYFHLLPHKYLARLLSAPTTHFKQIHWVAPGGRHCSRLAKKRKRESSSELDSCLNDRNAPVEQVDVE